MPLPGITHFWYRFEWQERGSGHTYVFLWLKDAPDANEVEWDLLKREDAVIPDEQSVKMCLFVEYWDRS